MFSSSTIYLIERIVHMYLWSSTASTHPKTAVLETSDFEVFFIFRGQIPTHRFKLVKNSFQEKFPPKLLSLAVVQISEEYSSLNWPSGFIVILSAEMKA